MRENSGSMKKNARKESEKHADYKGKVNIAGREYWLSGWVKEGVDKETGAPEKWLSLAFTAVEDAGSSKPEPKRSNYAAANAGDDIPF